MNLKIGTIIKELRTKRRITQDQLASAIGVTPQAISRWESGTGYPDIEYLPALADYFGITADELLGINRDERAARLEEIYREIERLEEVGTDDENLSFARKAVAEFPSEERLQLNLAVALQRKTVWNDEPDMEMLSESEKILLMLLDTTSDQVVRYDSICNLAIHYSTGVKDHKRAEELLDLLPKMKYCREFAKSAYLEENEIFYMQDEIDKLADCLGTSIFGFTINSLPNDPSTWDRKIGMLRIGIQIYTMIYGDDLKFNHCRLSHGYHLISTYQVAQGKIDETFESLEQMCRHAIAYDDSYVNERGKHYSSPFVDHLIYPEISEDFHELKEHSDSWHMLDRLNHSRYDVIRDDPRFTDIVTRLAEYAR